MLWQLLGQNAIQSVHPQSTQFYPIPCTIVPHFFKKLESRTLRMASDIIITRILTVWGLEVVDIVVGRDTHQSMKPSLDPADKGFGKLRVYAQPGHVHWLGDIDFTPAFPSASTLLTASSTAEIVLNIVVDFWAPLKLRPRWQRAYRMRLKVRCDWCMHFHFSIKVSSRWSSYCLLWYW